MSVPCIYHVGGFAGFAIGSLAPDYFGELPTKARPSGQESRTWTSRPRDIRRRPPCNPRGGEPQRLVRHFPEVTDGRLSALHIHSTVGAHKDSRALTPHVITGCPPYSRDRDREASWTRATEDTMTVSIR